MKNILPTEKDEGKVLHQYLELKKIPHTHIVNESGRLGDVRYGALLKSMGRSKGFPDYLIFLPNREEYVPLPHEIEDGHIENNSSCYKVTNFIPVAIELKRQKGGKVSQEQENWLEILSRSGFHCNICYGANEAIAFVERIIRSKTLKT